MTELVTRSSIYKPEINATTILFGNNMTNPLKISSNNQLHIIAQFFKDASTGLHSGTELDALSNIMADKGSNQNAELIIISDGDLTSTK